jgi:hypothetical protein
MLRNKTSVNSEAPNGASMLISEPPVTPACLLDLDTTRKVKGLNLAAAWLVAIS